MNYAKFNEYCEDLVNYGMIAQQSIMYHFAYTSYLTSLTKALRGDGKVSSQQLSSMVDLIEREISQDLEDLDRIQSMQEKLVELNNRQFNSLRQVERSAYEAVFFAAYGFSSVFLQFKLSLLDIVLVKTLSNMFQGFFGI